MPQMELAVLERMVLFNVIPKEGDIFTVKLVRKLREAIAFSEEEKTLLELEPAKDEEGKLTGGMVWDEDKDPNKPVKFGPKMFVIIGDVLRKMNEEKKLTPAHVSLYEKFVEEQDKEDDDDVVEEAVAKVTEDLAKDVEKVVKLPDAAEVAAEE